MTTNQERPRRIQPDGLVEQEVGSELMLFDPGRNKAFCLNKTAAFVWKNSDGSTSVSEIAGKLSGQVNEPAGEETVCYALDLLEKDGLLEPVVAASAGAAASPRKTITRRALLQKIGIGAIPAITILFVHPARAHASSLPSLPGGTGNGSPGGVNAEVATQHHGGGFWQWLEDLFS